MCDVPQGPRQPPCLPVHTLAGSNPSPGAQGPPQPSEGQGRVLRTCCGWTTHLDPRKEGCPAVGTRPPMQSEWLRLQGSPRRGSPGPAPRLAPGRPYPHVVEGVGLVVCVVDEAVPPVVPLRQRDPQLGVNILQKLAAVLDSLQGQRGHTHAPATPPAAPAHGRTGARGAPTPPVRAHAAPQAAPSPTRRSHPSGPCCAGHRGASRGRGGVARALGRSEHLASSPSRLWDTLRTTPGQPPPDAHMPASARRSRDGTAPSGHQRGRQATGRGPACPASGPHPHTPAPSSSRGTKRGGSSCMGR